MFKMYQDLREAIREDDVAKIKLLLPVGRRRRLKAAKELGLLLHYTANVEVASLLLSRGANVNQRKKTGDHALFSICRGEVRSEELFDLFIQYGIEVNAQNLDGLTPLHCAVMNGKYNLSMIKKLLRHGANVNAVDAEGETPLHLLVHNRDDHLDPIESIKEILKQKIFTKCRNSGEGPSTGHSFPCCEITVPKNKSKFDSQIDVVKELLENGANVNIANFLGKTPVHVVVENEDSNLDIINELLKHDANVSATTFGELLTPLHVAVYNINSNIAVIEALLRCNADVEVADRKNNTPLHWAVLNHCPNLEVIRKLLSLGANINAENYYTNTPLHISAKTQPFVTKELLKWKPNINAKNFDGDTPLAIAVKYCCSYPYIIKDLLDAGADVHVVNNACDTPLHLAVDNCDITFDVLKEVLITGILESVKTASDSVRAYLDKIKKDTKSLKKYLDRMKTVTPPTIVQNRKNKLTVVRELLKHGAVINAVSHQGHTPLNVAIDKLDSKLDDGSCSKMLIQYTVLRDFDNESYRQSIDLTVSQDLQCHGNLTNHLEQCVVEVGNMQGDKIGNSLTLYEFVTNKVSIENLEFATDETTFKVVDEIFKRLVEEKYPLYADVISDKIPRVVLVDKMMNQCLYSVNEDNKKITLDSYATCSIIEYLSQLDLINLTIAFSPHFKLKDAVDTDREAVLAPKVEQEPIDAVSNEEQTSLKRPGDPLPEVCTKHIESGIKCRKH